MLWVLAALVAAACGEATEDEPSPDEGGPATTAPAEPGQPQPQASDADFEALAQHAEAAGQVRVIVGVQAGFTPEGEQDPATTAAQRAAIRREQDRVLAALAGTDHVVERRFDSVPQIALTLSPEAVEALRRSGLAASVQVDAAVPPA